MKSMRTLLVLAMLLGSFATTFGQSKSAPTALTVDQVIALRKAGVGDDIIKAMLVGQSVTTTTPATELSSGIYSNSTALTIETFQSEAFNPVKGLFKTMAGGMNQKAIANGASSQVRLPRAAKFTFFGTEAPQSFTLVKLEQKSDKRQIVILKVKVTGRDSGFDSKKVIHFTGTQAGDKRWVVEVSLDPGEYMFFVGDIQVQEFIGASLRGRAYTFGVD